MFSENRIADQDVQRAAAEDGGGAVEEGGQHQEDFSVPGRGRYQGRAIKFELITLEPFFVTQTFSMRDVTPSYLNIFRNLLWTSNAQTVCWLDSLAREPTLSVRSLGHVK